MNFNTPAEKSAALADHATRFAQSLAAVEAEPNPMVRAVKAACTIAAADFERLQIMAAPCHPPRPSLHNGGRVSLVQVLRRDS